MDDYLPVVVLLILAVVFGLMSAMVSKLLAPRRPTPAKSAPYECGIVPGKEAPERFPVRFYLVAMIFIIFDIEIIFLYPYAIIHRQLGPFGLWEMVLFAVAVFASFLYLISNGALDWGPVKRIRRLSDSAMVSPGRTAADHCPSRRARRSRRGGLIEPWPTSSNFARGLEGLDHNFLTGTIESLVKWARQKSMFPATFGLACCAIEMMATGGPHYDLARYGMEVFRASPRQADLMIVAGRVSQKMAPVLRQIYDQMMEPKWVISMGVCASSGGMFNNYAIVQGVDQVVPVDVYAPGCPPGPETLMHSILTLYGLIETGEITRRRETTGAGAGVHAEQRRRPARSRHHRAELT